MWHLLILLFSSVQLGLIRLKLLRMIWSHRSLKLKRLCIITLHIMDVRSDSISGWEKEKLNKRDKWCNLKNCVWFKPLGATWWSEQTSALFGFAEPQMRSSPLCLRLEKQHGSGWNTCCCSPRLQMKMMMRLPVTNSHKNTYRCLQVCLKQHSQCWCQKRRLQMFRCLQNIHLCVSNCGQY